MSQSPKHIEALSRKLAALAGLRLRVPQKGDPGFSEPGYLRSLLPEEFFHWRKCPFHNVWMQPALKPFVHWACMAKDYCSEMHHAGNGNNATHIKCKGHVCTFKRAAKMRTRIERRIFAVYELIEKAGGSDASED